MTVVTKVGGIADAMVSDKYVMIHTGTELVAALNHTGQVTSKNDVEHFDTEAELITRLTELEYDVPEDL